MMKKSRSLWIAGIAALCLSSCGTKWFSTRDFVSSFGYGYGPSYLKIENEAAHPISAFDTMISLTRYEKKNSFADIAKDFNLNFQMLHAYFDTHYRYSLRGEELSNLKTLNEHYGEDEFIRVPRELYEILTMAVDMTVLSKGKFNVAVGSLSDLWDDYIRRGQEQEDLSYAVPSEEEIKSALSAVPSYEEIGNIVEFDETTSSVRIGKLEGAEEPVRLTLGAIGKGYAVRAMEKQFRGKMTGYISGGESSVAMLSDAPFSEWTLALSNPVYRRNTVSGFPRDHLNSTELRLRKKGIFSFSTSGNYERFYYGDNGRIMHHILNPIDGYPTEGFSSVSVLCDDSAFADALTTALMAMTLEEGKEFICAVEKTYDITALPIWMRESENRICVYADSRLEYLLTLDRGEEKNAYISSLEFIRLNHE